MYSTEDYRTFKIDGDGERTLLANFAAQIIKEIRYMDGIETQTFLTLVGQLPPDEPEGDPTPLPEVEVPAAQFAGMQWVLQAWGVRAVIQPGSGTKDDLRAAIQMSSKPVVSTVYKHTGWTQTEGQAV